MQIVYNRALQDLNSFRLPAFAKRYIRFETAKEVADFCLAVKRSDLDFYVLGGGSNTLFVQTNPPCILHACMQGIEVVNESTHDVWIRAGAGVVWDELVLFCVSRGYGGIENLSWIPGTVGAAPIQNIGAYGVELKAVLHQVEAVAFSSGSSRVFSAEECALEYRTSAFKTTLRNQYFLTSVVLALQKTKKICLEYAGIREKLEAMQVTHPTMQAVRKAVVALRQEKLPDPAALGNAGSFFKNPLVAKKQYNALQKKYPALVGFPTQDPATTKLSAAWLIEQAGFKGFREGNVGVCATHALVLVQYGGATGQAVCSLAKRIQAKIKELFEVELEPEVHLV